MTTTWILVADGARARLFETRDRDALSELACYTSAEGRSGGRGLSTDRAPTVHESVGPARHALEHHTNPRQKTADTFARTLREVLDHGRRAQRFEQLVLVAPSRFLGALRATFDKALHNMVVIEIQRDLTQFPAKHIQAQLPAQVFQ